MHINAVSQDEAVSGTGIGDPTFPDAHFTAAGADSSEVEVCDEQSPLGEGRVYHVAFTVTDAHAASCVGDSTVAVTRAPIQPAVDLAPPVFHSFTGAPSPSRVRMDAEDRDLGVHTARADHPRETDHRAAFIAPGATCVAPLLDVRWTLQAAPASPQHRAPAVTSYASARTRLTRGSCIRLDASVSRPSPNACAWDERRVDHLATAHPFEWVDDVGPR